MGLLHAQSTVAPPLILFLFKIKELGRARQTAGVSLFLIRESIPPPLSLGRVPNRGRLRRGGGLI